MEVTIYTAPPSKNELLEWHSDFLNAGRRDLADRAFTELQIMQRREDMNKISGLRRELASC